MEEVLNSKTKRFYRILHLLHPCLMSALRAKCWRARTSDVFVEFELHVAFGMLHVAGSMCIRT